MAQSLNDIADRVYPRTQHTRKPPAYLETYQTLLAPFLGREISLLELGVHSGHSLLLWREFLPDAKIAGLDLRAEPENVSGLDNVTYVCGRQEDPGVLDRVAARHGPFDLIFDDASHVGRLTKASYLHLIGHLKPGGLYIFEDIAASTALPDWPDYAPMEARPDEGDRFPSYETGMIGMLKQLVDQVSVGSPVIESLTFHPSMAVLKKWGGQVSGSTG